MFLSCHLKGKLAFPLRSDTPRNHPFPCADAALIESGDNYIQYAVFYLYLQCAPTGYAMILSMQVDSPSSEKGRLKRTWMKVIRIDLKKCNLPENLLKDRSE